MRTRRPTKSILLLAPVGVLLGTLAAIPLFAEPAAGLNSDRTLEAPSAVVMDNGFRMDAAAAESTPGGILEPGMGWSSFTWYGDGPVFAREGPVFIDVSFPVTLRITDSYAYGDRFRVFDVKPDGVWQELAETFETTAGPGMGADPDRAFADDSWTSGIYSLEPGPHEIRIQLADNPWRMGRAFLKIDREHTFESLLAEDVMTDYGEVRHHDRLRYRAAIALATDSDGIAPNLEDVVISYGRYIEVIPGGSFICNSVDCTYSSSEPGIQQAILSPNLVFFSGVDVDLCPGSNPLVVGVWIGNDGGVLRMRCRGTLHE
jgi:hypothetical protein